MNKIALALTLLAGLSTAAFASQRNQDPDFGSTKSYSTYVQGAKISVNGNSAFAIQQRNMDAQSHSNRK